MSKISIDQTALDFLVRSPQGPMGRAMLRFVRDIEGGVRKRQLARTGGEFYRTTSGVTRKRDLIATVQMRGTRRHFIPLVRFPARGRRLKFVPRGGGVAVFARQVDHPGSTPPARYLLQELKNTRLRGP